MNSWGDSSSLGIFPHFNSIFFRTFAVDLEKKGDIIMAGIKRKYQLYRVLADDGEVNEEYQTYKEAFSKYQRQDAPKTMYGITKQGNMELVLAQ